jgi:hypothetical protein
MDATTGSSGNGFDAALRALEDLETSVAQARGEQAAPSPIEIAPIAIAPIAIADAADPAPGSAAAPSPTIDFSEDDEVAPAAVITAVPIAALEVQAEETTADPVVATPAPAAFEIATATPLSTPPLPVTPAAAPIAASTAAPVVPVEEKPATVARASKRGALLGKFAIGLGLVSSVVSAAGLIIAERTIVSAQLVVATARERQEQLESANRLVHDLQTIRDRQIELLKAQQAQLASAPVTSAELQHRMETLQAGLLERDPLTEVVQTVREGQSMTNARLNEFEKKMDRVEAAMNGH